MGLVLGDRLRLAAQRDQDPLFAALIDVTTDSAIVSRPAGKSLDGFEPALPQLVVSLVHIPVGFHQGPLAFHHRKTGLFSERLNTLRVHGHV